MESLFQGSSTTVVPQVPLQPEVFGLIRDGAMRCDPKELLSPGGCLPCTFL